MKVERSSTFVHCKATVRGAQSIQICSILKQMPLIRKEQIFHRSSSFNYKPIVDNGFWAGGLNQSLTSESERVVIETANDRLERTRWCTKNGFAQAQKSSSPRLCLSLQSSMSSRRKLSVSFEEQWRDYFVRQHAGKRTWLGGHFCMWSFVGKELLDQSTWRRLLLANEWLAQIRLTGSNTQDEKEETHFLIPAWQDKSWVLQTHQCWLTADWRKMHRTATTKLSFVSSWKGAVPIRDTCHEHNVLIWVCCMNESIWTGRFPFDLCVQQNNGQPCWPKARSRPINVSLRCGCSTFTQHLLWMLTVDRWNQRFLTRSTLCSGNSTREEKTASSSSAWRKPNAFFGIRRRRIRRFLANSWSWNIVSWSWNKFRKGKEDLRGSLYRTRVEKLRTDRQLSQPRSPDRWWCKYPDFIFDAHAGFLARCFLP